MVKEVTANWLSKGLDAFAKDEAFAQSKITICWDFFLEEKQDYLNHILEWSLTGSVLTMEHFTGAQ